ncbi:MAG: hypothetical protein U1E27_01550, partial [Kiritimatiellia bacterium]|nr:hypothetical protein [Kiritimatiellia bacterium]
FFWLYARRGENSMVRFGFDQTGNMFLQAWRDGRSVANETRYWARPAGPVTLRLEVRADGAAGYVNGRPFFPAPVTIPRDLNLGWWGLAPWAPQFGLAQVTVRRVGGGPLPVRFGLLRSDDERRRDEDLLQILKPHARHLSALIPRWFVQEVDGTLRKETRGENTDLRIFCRYYRLRLMPLVRSGSPLTLDIPSMIQMAQSENLDGFTLHVARMPPDEWFNKVQESLIGSGIHFQVFAIDEEGRRVILREASAGFGLFPGRRIERILPLWIDGKAPDGVQSAPPDAAQPAPPDAVESVEPPVDETGIDAVLLL